MEVKGILSVAPAQNGLPVIVPVVIVLEALGVVILILSTIIGGSLCPVVPMLNHLKPNRILSTPGLNPVSVDMLIDSVIGPPGFAL